MICPYPDCNAEVAGVGGVGYCVKCACPVFQCPKCEVSNRAFARYCRKCNHVISFPETQLLLGGGARAELSAQPKQVVINRPFWVTPLAYKGFLWCLSATGDVIKVSPFEESAQHFGTLGSSFGKSAFTVMPRPEDETDNLPPYLLAASPDALSGINLLTGEVREFLRASAGEQLLSNFGDEYAGVESRGRTVFFLKRRDGRVYLAALDLRAMTVKQYALPEGEVVGPLRVGDRVGVYSRSAVYLLDEGEVKEVVRFAPSFRAWVTPGENSQLQPRVGRLPFITQQNSIYVPGATGGVPGFLYVSLRGGAASSSFFPLAGESCCAQDAGSRLLVARAGGLDVYEGMTARAVRLDPQLNAQAPAYHDDSLTACFVKSAGGVEALRFYYGNKVGDYSLAQLGRPTAMEFLAVAGTLALPYLGEGAGGSCLGIVIWDVR